MNKKKDGKEPVHQDDPAKDPKADPATGDQGGTPPEDDEGDAPSKDQDPDVNDSANPDEEPEEPPVDDEDGDDDDDDSSEPLPLPEKVKASLEAEYPVLGRKREVPLGHGSHDAAVSGFTTDASGSYTPPWAMKEE